MSWANRVKQSTRRAIIMKIQDEAGRVSVVIPAYNAAKTIDAAIQSALAQTYGNMEIIIVDDASSDETHAIAALIAEKDPRVKVFSNPVNIGPGLSRDVAIEKSSGSWIAVLDADDEWHPDRIRLMLEAIRFDTNAMVADNVMCCNVKNGRLVPWRELRRANLSPYFGAGLAEVDLSEYLAFSRMLLKPVMPARIIHEHHIRHSPDRFGEDAEFFVRVLQAAGRKMTMISQPLYLYRLRGDSLSTDRSWPLNMRNVLQRLSREIELETEDKLALEAKLSFIEHLIAYAEWRDRIVSLPMHKAIGTALQSPSLLWMMVRRILRRARYRMHLAISGSEGR